MTKDSHYAKRKNKWDTLASTWVDTGPPASPSNEDVENYKQFLLESLIGLNTGKFLLLGCTPKLRTMLSSFDAFKRFEVICIDFSLEMYKETTKTIKSPNPNERFEFADWLKLNIGKEEFAAILGDKVIDNIMPDHWMTFFERLHYHLHPGGYFITRLALADRRFKFVTFESALKKWTNYDGTRNLDRSIR